MLADVYPSNELGTVMGISLMFMSLGMLLGPPFGGVVYEYAGYETPFLIAAGIAAFDGLVRLLLVTDKLPKKEDNTDKIGINKDIESGTSSSSLQQPQLYPHAHFFQLRRKRGRRRRRFFFADVIQSSQSAEEACHYVDLASQP